MKAFLFAPVFLVGTAAHAQDQFDLSCEGMRSIEGVPGRAARTHIRIDLAARRYCSDQCSDVQPIDGVTADRIDFHVPSIGSSATAVQASGTSYFDRAAGRYHNIMVINATISRGSARSTMRVTEDMACVAAPFSGFPAR